MRTKYENLFFFIETFSIHSTPVLLVIRIAAFFVVIVTNVEHNSLIYFLFHLFFLILGLGLKLPWSAQPHFTSMRPRSLVVVVANGELDFTIIIISFLFQELALQR